MPHGIGSLFDGRGRHSNQRSTRQELNPSDIELQLGSALLRPVALALRVIDQLQRTIDLPLAASVHQLPFEDARHLRSDAVCQLIELRHSM